MFSDMQHKENPKAVLTFENIVGTYVSVSIETEIPEEHPYQVPRSRRRPQRLTRLTDQANCLQFTTKNTPI